MNVQSLKTVVILASLISAGAFTTTTSAAPVTSIAGGTVLTLPVENYFGNGPKTVTPNITWSSNNNQAVYGYTNGYGFASNGTWDNNLIMVGSNSPTDEMTFTFANPVDAFGGFFNFAPGFGSPATISAYDATNTLLDTFVLTFTTGGGNDQGEFHGFSEFTANISSFKMAGEYIGGANFVVGNAAEAAAVPEPESLTLFGLGLLAFAAARRKSVKSKIA